MPSVASVLKLERFDRENCERPQLEYKLSTADRELLEWLRTVALDVQLQGRVDIERSCELIAVCPGGAPHRYACALINAAITYTIVHAPFYRKGTMDVSRIEAWLVRLLSAVKSDDHTSTEMLIRSSIKPAGQRWIRFLAKGLSEVI